MKTPKNQLYLLFFSLSVLLLIFLDTNFGPSKQYVEVLRIKEPRLQQGRMYSSYQYRMGTFSGVYIVPWQVYYNVEVGDSVKILKSEFFNAPKLAIVMEDGVLRGYSLAYINRPFGRVLFVLVLTAVMLTLVFFKRDWNLVMRRNWVSLLSMATILLLLLHLQWI